jgi:hypothetical protein
MMWSGSRTKKTGIETTSGQGRKKNYSKTN